MTRVIDLRTECEALTEQSVARSRSRPCPLFGKCSCNGVTIHDGATFAMKAWEVWVCEESLDMDARGIVALEKFHSDDDARVRISLGYNPMQDAIAETPAQDQTSLTTTRPWDARDLRVGMRVLTHAVGAVLSVVATRRTAEGNVRVNYDHDYERTYDPHDHLYVVTDRNGAPVLTPARTAPAEPTANSPRFVTASLLRSGMVVVLHGGVSATVVEVALVIADIINRAYYEVRFSNGATHRYLSDETVVVTHRHDDSRQELLRATDLRVGHVVTQSNDGLRRTVAEVDHQQALAGNRVVVRYDGEERLHENFHADDLVMVVSSVDNRLLRESDGRLRTTPWLRRVVSS